MVSIRLVLNGGIITHAEDATSKYKVEEEKEKISLGYSHYQMSKYTGETAVLSVDGATVTGDATSGWHIKFNDSGNTYQLSGGGTVEEYTPVENPYDSSGWAFAYTCTNGTWSDKIEDVNQAQGDIVAKFYATGKTIPLSSFTLDDMTVNLSGSAPEYHLVIEGTGNMGGLTGDYDLKQAWVPDMMEKIFSNSGDAWDMASVTKVWVCDGIHNIGSGAFFCAVNLKDVVMSDSIQVIGSNAFAMCKSLVNIKIPKNVTEIPHSIFDGCDSLQSITIPDGVTYIYNGAFYNCKSLTRIEIPATVTAIRGDAFFGCTSLMTVKILNKEIIFSDATNDALKDLPEDSKVYVFEGSDSKNTVERQIKPDKTKVIEVTEGDMDNF